MPTKEQKIYEIRKELSKMLIQVEVHAKTKRSLHEVESDLFKSLLHMGLGLLKYYIILVQQLEQCSEGPLDDNGYKYEDKGKSSRKYRSIFGLLKIERKKYYSRELKTCYPLDARLGLPQSSYSYLLDDWLGYGAVERDFDQSVKVLNRILGQDLSAMQSNRRNYCLARGVSDYYESKEAEPVCQEHTHLSIGYDGKGIPIRRSETARAAENTASRLAKGKKKDVKREATLSLSSSFTAKNRDTEEIIEALFSTAAEQDSDEGQKPHCWHEAKHIRAFLSDKPKAIEYGLDQVLRRDPEGKKPIIFLMDGAPSLENTVKAVLEKKQIKNKVDAYILDFIHLLEYVWKVANAHLGENDPRREAWVKDQARKLLNSQHEQVLEQWKKIRATQKLSQYKTTLLERSIKYLTNRPHMIDYKRYLEKGYPIITGAVESACGHFIKSRMERNAMHWGKAGAQNMLDIRAVKKNQDWEHYLDFFISKEQQRLYRRAA